MPRKAKKTDVPFVPLEGVEGQLHEKLIRDFFQARYMAIAGRLHKLDALTTKKGRHQIGADVGLERSTMVMQEDTLDRVEFKLTDVLVQNRDKALTISCVEHYTRYAKSVNPQEGVTQGMQSHLLTIIKKGKNWLIDDHRHMPIDDQQLNEQRRSRAVPAEIREKNDEEAPAGPGFLRRLLPGLIKGTLAVILIGAGAGYFLWNFGPRTQEITVRLETGRERVTEQLLDYTYKVEERDTPLSTWVSHQSPRPGPDQEWLPAGGFRKGWLNDESEIQETPQVRRAKQILTAIKERGERRKEIGTIFLTRYFDIRQRLQTKSGDDFNQARSDLDQLALDLKLD